MRRAVAILACGGAAAVLACSSAYSGTEDEVPVLPDASTTDALPVEAAADTGVDVDTGDGATKGCDLGKPFGLPVALNELNDPAASEQAPRLASDELTIVFGSSRAGGAGQYDLYIATRAKRTDPFAAPQPLPTLNTPDRETHPWISGDGLTLLFTRVVTGSGADWDLYRSVRGSPGSAFGAAARLDVSMLNVIDLGPFLGPAGDLWFSSDRDGNGGTLAEVHIWRAAPIVGGFAAPTRVALGANDADSEFFPVLSADGLTLFTSRQPKSQGRNDFDAMIAVRDSVEKQFDLATPLPGLSNPGASELPGWLSPDGCRLYLTIGTPAQNEIYVATRP